MPRIPLFFTVYFIFISNLYILRTQEMSSLSSDLITIEYQRDETNSPEMDLPEVEDLPDIPDLPDFDKTWPDFDSLLQIFYELNFTKLQDLSHLQNLFELLNILNLTSILDLLPVENCLTTLTNEGCYMCGIPRPNIPPCPVPPYSPHETCLTPCSTLECISLIVNNTPPKYLRGCISTFHDYLPELTCDIKFREMCTRGMCAECCTTPLCNKRSLISLINLENYCYLDEEIVQLGTSYTHSYEIILTILSTGSIVILFDI